MFQWRTGHESARPELRYTASTYKWLLLRTCHQLRVHLKIMIIWKLNETFHVKLLAQSLGIINAKKKKNVGYYKFSPDYRWKRNQFFFQGNYKDVLESDMILFIHLLVHPLIQQTFDSYYRVVGTEVKQAHGTGIMVNFPAMMKNAEI